MIVEGTWTYPRASAVSVHDGDTVKLLIDCGLSTFRQVTVRLAHFNAPELRDEGGGAARDRLRELVMGGQNLVVTTVRDRTEKYGRYLAEIENSEGLDVVTVMISEGHGTAYEGGRR